MHTNLRLDRQRWRLLNHVIRTFEPIIMALGVVWLAIFIIDMAHGLTPALRRVEDAIWLIFAVDFVGELLIAPRKAMYLRRHWLTAVSLAIPALRIARIARLTRLTRLGRAARDVRLVRTVGTLNRAMAAFRATLRRRGAAYVSLTTAAVTLGGAAGMYAFEHGVRDPATLHDYPTAVWWTAMMMTTMGSAYWPQTPEGRILCVLLALYAFAVFGYVTASLASFFVDRDASSSTTDLAGAHDISALRDEIAALRALILERLPPPSSRQGR